MALKLLEEIPSFPKVARTTLESEYGIETAEAFYVHAVKNPDGMRSALHVDRTRLDRLVRAVEGYLSSDYIEACQKPVAKHPRGALVP